MWWKRKKERTRTQGPSRIQTRASEEAEAANQQGRVLSDEDLEGVAGGIKKIDGGVVKGERTQIPGRLGRG